MAVNANKLADDAAAAIEGVFGSPSMQDQLAALIAVRGQVSHPQRNRLFVALHRLQEQAHNALAQLTRDAAW